jgi:hypothetical protein
MQSMAVRGFITHNRETGVYGLTDSGRAALMEILANAGLKYPCVRLSFEAVIGRLLSFRHAVGTAHNPLRFPIRP